MRKKFFYLVIFSAIVGCSDTTSSFKATNGPSSDLPEEGALNDKSSACYPGPGKSTPKCWQTFPREYLEKSQARLYQYANPFTDSTFPDGFDKAQYAAPSKFLSLEDINIREWLSPSFMRIELMPSNLTRGTFGLFSRSVLARIQALRDELSQPMTITSGYRSPGYNSTLNGSAKWSRHTYGDAIDFAVDGVSFSRVARLCLKHGASFYQIYAGHIHCDWRGQALDPAFYGQGATLPGPAAHSHSLVAVVTAVKESAQIVEALRPHASTKSTLYLKTHIHQEDGGELAHQWEVVHPDGQVTYSQDAELNLNLSPGIYKVKVTVGGSIELDGEYRVDP